MTIREYLDSPGAMSLTDLAAAAEVSKGRLSQLAGAKDNPPKVPEDAPPALALRLERVTEGAIDAASISSIIAQARMAAA
jgi:hypothetical protein